MNVKRIGIGEYEVGKKGRPVGWRKPDARRHSIMIRLHKSEKKALKKLAKKHDMSVGECVRWLLYTTFPPLKW